MQASPVVFLVDDDPSVLRAVGRLLTIEGFEPRTFATPTAFLKEHDPDVPGCVVLDFAMPGLNGLELQKLIGASPHGRPIVFISGHCDIPTSVTAMKGGAVDFLTKPFDDERLLEAVRDAVLRDRMARRSQAAQQQFDRRFASLTRRECEVYKWVVKGKINKQIATALGIVEKTVKVHRGRMMAKMGVRTLAELVQTSRLPSAAEK